MDEARAFLALPSSAAANGGPHAAVMTVKKRHAAFGGAVSPSMAPKWKLTCTPAPLAIAVSRPYGFIPISSIEVMTASTAYRRWSPPSPAIMASPRACGASGSIPSAPRRGRSLSDRAKRPGASTAGPCALAGPLRAPLLTGKGIETVLSLITTVPRIHAAAALIGRHPRRLRTTPRPLPVGHRPR